MVAVDRRTRIKTLKGRNNFSHTLSAFQRSAKIAASTSPSRLYTPCLFLLRFSFFFLRPLFSLPHARSVLSRPLLSLSRPLSSLLSLSLLGPTALHSHLLFALRHFNFQPPPSFGHPPISVTLPSFVRPPISVALLPPRRLGGVARGCCSPSDSRSPSPRAW